MRGVIGAVEEFVLEWNVVARSHVYIYIYVWHV